MNFLMGNTLNSTFFSRGDDVAFDEAAGAHEAAPIAVDIPENYHLQVVLVVAFAVGL
jgi:hypothetical protein